MVAAEIVTPYAGDGLSMETGYHPQLVDEYAVVEWVNVTATTDNIPPDPNAYMIRVIVTDAVMQQIEADGTYPVLWSEEVT